ncbi:MAG TPA: S8 family serine peptidase, partial [Verrucomicrobiae bacterium]|nr:S8 family serine peptidase [Verrucomicrobiae bacterium]
MRRIHFLIIALAMFCVTVASAQTHKLRVNDRELAKDLIAHGAKLVADYGSFQIIDGAEIPADKRLAERVQNEDRLDRIELNAREIDTRSPEATALRSQARTSGGKRLHLVQFAGPIKPEWVVALEKNGGHIVSYIPNDAYLIYGDAAALGKMQGWAKGADFVQWDGDYADDYKIHPRARMTDENGNAQEVGTDTFAIQLVDDPEANAVTLAIIDRLKLSPIKSMAHVLNYLNVIVRIPVNRLAEIAAQPEVVSIQPHPDIHMLDERQDQIVAGNLSISTGLPNGPGYLPWLASKGFNQAQFTNSGFVVNVSDSGLDNGSTTPGHFEFYQFGNPDLPSRVVYARLEGTSNANSTVQGCDGHGNLNSHIIAGYCDMTNFPHTDSVGYRYGLGVCPFVKLGSSVVFDPSTFTSPNYAKLEGDAYRDGARVSANSWGADASGAYNTDAQAYDALVRN